ncbi:3-dehydroquinate synthase [Candidatus Xianfuyuplasma coldseepsis]|uniref:3-dehydroquinate synthase n=1 Tax=Candidatus Xianfuyuplasma coldseepsis TaxID=2782163 RepID=A0A7L7KRN9_9MOLU|nr:3-dehydroquinate synthase [Xianfuyuplasma coldseepsis]QMS84932.1 3-dehydroquinate synthase [Xianfuyuplasma coldseepsis]
MLKVPVVLPGREYNIIIEQHCLQHINDYVDPSREIVIITDDNIPKQYLNTIAPLLGDPFTLFVPQGESSKSMEMAQLLCEKMLKEGITRNALILALGGGMVGDLAGFVASIYMRGIDYIQIPTTLLSQIDSSVGGKVGVNASIMKNAIGAFKQPQLVLIDSTTLQTLDQRQVNSGIAEMIKYGLIASKSLFKALLEDDILPNIDNYIYECVSIKRDVVIKDERDTGVRQILNFGHTIGHAIEQASKYQLLHGEAVAIGMVIMAKNKSYYNDLIHLLAKYNLPTSYEYDKDEIYQYITTDKKATKTSLNIIVVDEVGNGYIEPIEISQIKEKL